MESLLTSPAEIYALVIIPLFIFSARVCDVSLGTLRVIFISRGVKLLAPLIGFFEVIIWLLAIGQIMQNLYNPISYLAYGAGFGMGTYVGMRVEEYMSLGLVLIRIITRRDATPLLDFLRSENYGLTVSEAQGLKGQVKIIFSIIKRRDLPHIIEIIRRFNPHAFYSVEDIRYVSEALLPTREGGHIRNFRKVFGMRRKEK